MPLQIILDNPRGFIATKFNRGILSILLFAVWIIVSNQVIRRNVFL